MIAALFAASLSCAAPQGTTSLSFASYPPVPDGSIQVAKAPSSTPTLAPYPWPTATVDPLLLNSSFGPIVLRVRDERERSKDAERILMVTWAYLYAADDAKWLRDEIDQHFRRVRLIRWEEFKRKQMDTPRQ